MPPRAARAGGFLILYCIPRKKLDFWAKIIYTLYCKAVSLYGIFFICPGAALPAQQMGKRPVLLPFSRPLAVFVSKAKPKGTVL